MKRIIFIFLFSLFFSCSAHKNIVKEISCLEENSARAIYPQKLSLLITHPKEKFSHSRPEIGSNTKIYLYEEGDNCFIIFFRRGEEIKYLTNDILPVNMKLKVLDNYFSSVGVNYLTYDIYTNELILVHIEEYKNGGHVTLRELREDSNLINYRF